MRRPNTACSRPSLGERCPPAELDNRLSQLREIALLLAADVVDHQLEDYMQRQGVGQPFGAQERILVCITPRANGARMLARARFARDRFHGELLVVLR